MIPCEFHQKKVHSCSFVVKPNFKTLSNRINGAGFEKNGSKHAKYCVPVLTLNTGGAYPRNQRMDRNMATRIMRTAKAAKNTLTSMVSRVVMTKDGRF